MRILSMHAGHDGAIAFIEDGVLRLSVEAEKDSNPRYSVVRAHTVMEVLEAVNEFPDVVALGGWHSVGGPRSVGAGYTGLGQPQSHEGNLFGRRVRYVHSTHERSHVYMSTCMAPQAPIEECAILTWEGVIGSFYHWRRGGADLESFPVLHQPGQRYAALFCLADPGFPDRGRGADHRQAGKLMALAGYADLRLPAAERGRARSRLPARGSPHRRPVQRGARRLCPPHVGVQRRWSSRRRRTSATGMFDVFLRAAKEHLPAGLPLMISAAAASTASGTVAGRSVGTSPTSSSRLARTTRARAIGTDCAPGHTGGPQDRVERLCRTSFQRHHGARLLELGAAPARLRRALRGDRRRRRGRLGPGRRRDRATRPRPPLAARLPLHRRDAKNC